MSALADKKQLIERVVNAFESGSASGNYALLKVYADGKDNSFQITFGRSQTTEQGNLKELVGMYIEADGEYSEGLAPYLSKLGRVPLYADMTFRDLLITAAKNDPIMREVQDAFFEKRYWLPALSWAQANGFTAPLSMLVIYDSFVHSGSILDCLRKRFATVPPARGGDEKEWIINYVDVRHHWLRLHPRHDLNLTIYRTGCLKEQIARGNWQLDQLPIDANGVKVNA